MTNYRLTFRWEGSKVNLLRPFADHDYIHEYYTWRQYLVGMVSAKQLFL